VTTPPSTPPSGRQSLDRFETALLGELKQHVAARTPEATRTPAPSRPHRRRRWAAGLAAAAATATAYVVVSPGGPAVSPAYAVDQQADGDVVVTIHRLEDAAGLEAALREHGIDAVVSFDPSSSHDEFTFAPGDLARGEGGTADRRDRRGSGPEGDRRGTVTQAEPGLPGEVPTPVDCGTGPEGGPFAEPATLTHEGDDWVLTIPAESPLQDRPVSITTGAGGDLGVGYAGDQPDSYCAVFSTSS
jgi:hypothetical protein